MKLAVARNSYYQKSTCFYFVLKYFIMMGINAGVYCFHFFIIFSNMSTCLFLKRFLVHRQLLLLLWRERVVLVFRTILKRVIYVFRVSTMRPSVLLLLGLLGLTCGVALSTYTSRVSHPIWVLKCRSLRFVFTFRLKTPPPPTTTITTTPITTTTATST